MRVLNDVVVLLLLLFHCLPLFLLLFGCASSSQWHICVISFVCWGCVFYWVRLIYFIIFQLPHSSYPAFSKLVSSSSRLCICMSKSILLLFPFPLVIGLYRNGSLGLPSNMRVGMCVCMFALILYS